MKTTIKLEAEEVNTWIDWLASYGLTENGGVTRLLYDENWVNAQNALFEKMKESSLQPYFDKVGNLFGRLEGTIEKEKIILTGSHIDTVLDGGKYDGAYGVIASFLSIQLLQKYYGLPKKTIEVVSLCEEEGSRFPLAFWGSGSITGKYNVNDCIGLKDIDNLAFADEMNASVRSYKQSDVKREDIDAFIEIHIEQGGILEAEKKSIGIVTHIVGQRRFTIKIMGESNHAGTTPMPYRKDSVHLASELIAYALNKVSTIDQHLVATVGKINASPNIPNVIAEEVVFTLDVRHHEEEKIENYCQIIFSYCQEKCLEFGMGIDIEQWVDVKPVVMNEHLTELSRNIVKEMNVPFREMVSGAGHDAQVFGSFCPTALVFVPSVNGISHSPKEFTEIEDLKNGIIVLSELLHKLAY